ncbi:STAS domain-containing protein [Streptomyces sp. NPDC059680]|uniref:STAS domain-containing protein n=1 Tax=Streptomyces sp. NPDC059680 TaxID=3346904 RepID=UPI00367D615E
MSQVIPILRLGDTLAISLQGDLDDSTVTLIEEQLTREVARTGATGTLIDVSGLTVVDSFAALMLTRMVAMIGLLGADACVVGIQPGVAVSMVELHVPLGHLNTALTAEKGLALLHQLRPPATLNHDRPTS